MKYDAYLVCHLFNGNCFHFISWHCRIPYLTNLVYNIFLYYFSYNIFLLFSEQMIFNVLKKLANGFYNWKFVWFNCLHFWFWVNWVHWRSIIFCVNCTGMHTLSFLPPSQRSRRWSRAQRTSPNSTVVCSECWNTSNISQSLKVSVLINMHEVLHWRYPFVTYVLSQILVFIRWVEWQHCSLLQAETEFISCWPPVFTPTFHQASSAFCRFLDL